MLQRIALETEVIADPTNNAAGKQPVSQKTNSTIPRFKYAASDFYMDTIGDDSGCRGRLGRLRHGGVPSNVFSVAGDLLRFGVAQLARRQASSKS